MSLNILLKICDKARDVSERDGRQALYILSRLCLGSSCCYISSSGIFMA